MQTTIIWDAHTGEAKQQFPFHSGNFCITLISKMKCIFNIINIISSFAKNLSAREKFELSFLCVYYPEYCGLWVYSFSRKMGFCDSQL